MLMIDEVLNEATETFVMSQYYKLGAYMCAHDKISWNGTTQLVG